jgi:hypothetical protein
VFSKLSFSMPVGFLELNEGSKAIEATISQSNVEYESLEKSLVDELASGDLNQ